MQLINIYYVLHLECLLFVSTMPRAAVFAVATYVHMGEFACVRCFLQNPCHIPLERQPFALFYSSSKNGFSLSGMPSRIYAANCSGLMPSIWKHHSAIILTAEKQNIFR